MSLAVCDFPDLVCNAGWPICTCLQKIFLVESPYLDLTDHIFLVENSADQSGVERLKSDD